MNTERTAEEKSALDYLLESADMFNSYGHPFQGKTSVMGYSLEERCGACPEDYDVFLGEENVGYLRLRHGRLSIEITPNGAVSGNPAKRTYIANPKGDGVFDCDEREHFIRWCVMLIDANRRSRGKTVPARTEAEMIEMAEERGRLRNILGERLIDGHEEALQAMNFPEE